MSFIHLKEKQELDSKTALLNLTKILSVTQADNLINKICPFFVYKEEMKNINRNFPLKFNINNSDPLGPFIESEFNQDENSFRSPWSNTYFPTKESNKHLPKELRLLEEKINMMIKLYLKIYYGLNAISSAYITFTDESISNGFTCCVLIENKINNSSVLEQSSFLESTNTINVKFMRERSKDPNKEKIKVIYKTSTTFLFKLKIKDDDCEFNGTESCENNKTAYIKDYFEAKTHLENIGKSIEENEGKLRLKLDKIYLEKKNFICNEIRSKDDENKNRVKNLKNICTEFEKYATSRKMKAEAKKNQ